MIATQSVSPSDNFDLRAKRKAITKPKHIITHSRHRELLLSKLMQPAEFTVVLLSPAFYLADLARRGRERSFSQDG